MNGTVFFTMVFCVLSCSTLKQQNTGTITVEEVLKAQELWSNGMVEIANTYQAKGDYKSAAEKHVDRCYGYDMGEVLFRPTIVWDKIYRPTKEGAISYFIGGNPDYPNDRKTINPLMNVRFENEGIKIEGIVAIAMGRYYFTREANQVVSPSEYAIVYKKNKNGQLKIIMHNSHQPYKPQ
jgi:hypothetical protein